jgi:hypothetical protein
MGIFRNLTVPLAALFIVGCSGQSPDPPPPPAKTVFDPLTNDLKRAHDVQNTVDANTDSTRKAVDSQERGDNPP